MKKIVLAILIIIFAYQVWKIFNTPKLQWVYKRPYAIVYGFAGSENDRKYADRLKKRGIDCMFFDLSDYEVKQELDARIVISDLPAGGHITPIVEVNGGIFENQPDIEKIVEAYNDVSYKEDSPLNHPLEVELLDAKPYVVVYGSALCGKIQQYVKNLKNKGIDCIFKDINDSSNERELHVRMLKSGFRGTRYDLPVVDVNGKIFYNHPDIDKIIEAYNNTSKD